MTQIRQLDVDEIARGVRAGELSAVEVFDAFLERTREVEPRVGAYLRLFAADGRRRARELDLRRRRGEALGPLAGVPVAVKDNVAVAGRPLTCGSRMLRGFVSPFSATAVERLLDAGAVLLGSCNLDEYGMGSSCERSSFRPTRNPWHLGMVPGGSSGGSAAAVAAGTVPLALGSDTGGSIRQPAAFCGVVGLKPTYGRVSRWGLVAFASSTDQIGPLARDVRGAALALGVIAGRDRRDATSSPRPVGDYLAALDAGVDGLVAGVPRQLEVERLAADPRRDFERAVGRLEALGARIEEVDLPALGAAVACYYVLATSEASANLARFDGLRYGRRSPAGGGLEELTARSRREGFGAEVKRRILLGTFALSAGYHDAYYRRAQAVRETLRHQLLGALESADVLLLPTAPSGAFALGERVDDPLAMYLSDVYTTPASLAGIPALSVPSGRDRRGLPLGLQILARPFAEATALRVGRAFERAVGWRVEPELAAA
jgi:aspartyl-tRNA(Asn)/glutamyl-tRNA(Gln) amidotransferase subunit A